MMVVVFDNLVSVVCHRNELQFWNFLIWEQNLCFFVPGKKKYLQLSGLMFRIKTTVWSKVSTACSGQVVTWL